MEQREPHGVNRFTLGPEPCSQGLFKGYTRLDRISSAARKDRQVKFKALLPQFNEGNLRQAFRTLDGSKASGIDHVTKQDYSKDLDKNLNLLADEISRGGWRPKPSREKLIPKASGGTRPLAIGCLEDKVVQQLGAKILEAIYEPDFHRNSYGFRPNRNTHQALSRLYKVVSERPDNCVVVELDLEKFFNTVDHDKLIEILKLRIEDHHFLRLIRRMLRNSILSENGELKRTERGTPQGSPISPILANIYLDHYLDSWFDKNWLKHGELVRYADDAVFVFTSLATASEFKQALTDQLETVAGLKINDEKSGILQFDKNTTEGQLPFVGFSLYWGKARRESCKKLLKVKTHPKKFGQAIEKFNDWIKTARSRMPLEKIWEKTSLMLRGHFNYFGVSFNGPKLNHFYFTVVATLFKWLNRRSQKRSFTWEQFERRLMYRPLPRPLLGGQMIDITKGTITKLNHNMRSRMRKLRTYGSSRSSGRQLSLFT